MAGNTNKSKLYEGKKATGGGTSASDLAFNGNRAISRAVLGLQGVNLGTSGIKDTLEALLFPAVAPTCSLSVVTPSREFGQSGAYTLNWSVTRQTNPISIITVDGASFTPTGNNQSGTKNGTGSTAVGTYTKSMTVSDGSLSTNASATITYQYRVFWGTIAKNGTTQPITDADILGLTGSALSGTRARTLNNFGGGGRRLVFAWPSTFGEPSFTVNGLPNTAFTKVRSLSSFTNAYGAIVQMDVWVSNNDYNSALDSVIIS